MQNKRKYSFSDAVLVEHAKDILNLFVVDMADFADFDPDFNPTFATLWQDRINSAEDQLTNRILMNVQKQYTKDVLTAMENCRLYYKDVKYFAEKAFQHQPSIRNEFGFGTYAKVRSSQPLLIEFMRDLYNVANKYAVQLHNVNFDAAKIEHINHLANLLDQANREQNAYISGKQTITANRITVYNNLWAILVLVAEAAQTVYAHNKVKYKQYVLP